MTIDLNITLRTAASSRLTGLALGQWLQENGYTYNPDTEEANYFSGATGTVTSTALGMTADILGIFYVPNEDIGFWTLPDDGWQLGLWVRAGEEEGPMLEDPDSPQPTILYVLDAAEIDLSDPQPSTMTIQEAYDSLKQGSGSGGSGQVLDAYQHTFIFTNHLYSGEVVTFSLGIDGYLAGDVDASAAMTAEDLANCLAAAGYVQGDSDSNSNFLRNVTGDIVQPEGYEFTILGICAHVEGSADPSITLWVYDNSDPENPFTWPLDPSEGYDLASDSVNDVILTTQEAYDKLKRPVSPGYNHACSVPVVLAELR